MKYFLVTALIVCWGVHAPAQSVDLTTQIRMADSLVFDVGYNSCDTLVFEKMVSDDFEFWHDQSGTTMGKRAFVASIRDGLCRLPYKPIRQSIDSTIVVYPMYKNHELYAAVQHGTHHFYAVYAGKPAVLTSTARYTHIWTRQADTWQLCRVISYDHVPHN